MLYISSWQHIGYNEIKEVQNAIANHQVFTSRCVHNGGLYGDSSLNGTPVAHSRCNEICPNCGQYRRYEVYSYQEIMYAICESCNDEYMYVKTWEHEYARGEMGNSIMTSKLQDVIMRAIPAYRESRQAYLNHVRKARTWLNAKRREQIGAKYGIGVGDKLSDECALRIYSKEQEALELARQKKAAMHTFDDMTSHLNKLRASR